MMKSELQPLNSSINITALVSYKVFPAKMGGQKGIAFFYQYLSRLLPVTIVTTANNEPPQDSNFQVLPVLSNSKSRYANPLLFFKIKRILKENNSTHLILEHPYFGWLGLLLRAFCKIKLVVHSHNIESVRFKSMGKWWWRILWQYEKFVHQKMDINFFITDEDRLFAIDHFSLDPARCYTITYGFEISEPPSTTEKQASKKTLQKHHTINPDEKILLFNGTLDYKPNLDAVDIIINEINPVLLSNPAFKYKIIICGKGLPAHYHELSAYKEKNIIYAGFVDDINVYFKGADIFINPVTDGGGIKTKLVESLGYGLSVVSTISGAIGIPTTVTGNKLYRFADNDWKGFAEAIVVVDPTETIPTAFYEHFYWGNIAAKVKAILV